MIGEFIKTETVTSLHLKSNFKWKAALLKRFVLVNAGVQLSPICCMEESALYSTGRFIRERTPQMPPTHHPLQNRTRIIGVLLINITEKNIKNIQLTLVASDG